MLVALALTGPAFGQATAPEQILDQAVESYTRALNTERRAPRLEEFRRSQRLFERLAVPPAGTAALYTNLGNAALQAEDLGAAVLAYRRALALDADYPRALQNLDHVRSLLPPWVPRPEPADLFDSLFFWHRSVPVPTRELLAALCFLAASLLVAASIRLEQSALRNAAILPGLVWMAVVTSLVVEQGAGDRAEAVVTAPEAVARAADSRLAPSAFPQPLPGGVEVRILEERAPWLRVRLANGRDAWLSRSTVTRVVPGNPEAG